MPTSCNELAAPPHENCVTCPLYESGEYVSPTGSSASRYLIVGEAPGADEGLRGENFIGSSGKVLRSILRSVGINPNNEVQYTNTVRCRPPGNRTPKPEELAACAPLLNTVLSASSALAILATGRVALERFVTY